MAEETWERVDDWFARAIDLSEPERSEFVDQVTAGRPDARALLQELLAAADASATFLETPVEGCVDLPWNEVFSSEPETALASGFDRSGQRVGAYRLVRRIGRGGMATVYLAERADGEWDQQVALKLIRRGLDTEDIVRRFLAERQILSSLVHPNIARLLDGGSTEDGLPYLVMEHVDGERISDYCDRERLRIEDRLRLFIDVCSAVGYAHGKLVVHRDIKPSNILVDQAGEPKLLDFGIAKLLEPDEEAAVLTATGGPLLTPQYASPEQVRGEAITTATDVYQLGLLLCLLLAGKKPYRVSGRSAPRIETDVLGADPVPPSRLLDEEAAGKRRGSRTALSRRLGGELDTIVLKAIHKQPEDRYSSAEALATDIERHLKGHPILARPASRAYRVRKWLGRHRTTALGAAAGLLLLAGWAVTATLQASALERERDRVQYEAARATEVSDFLVTLFNLSRPWQSGQSADSMTVRELLEAGTQELEASLGEQPAERAAIAHALGRTWAQLRDIDRSIELFEESLALHQSLDGDHGLEIARDLRQLAGAYRFRDLDSAIALFEAALDTAERAGGPEDPLVAEILTTLALRGTDAGAFDRDSADVLYERALAIYRSRSDVPPEVLANALAVSAYGRPDRGDTVGLVRLREALALRREAFGDVHPNVAASLNDLGLAIRDSRPLEADSMLSESVEIFGATLGPHDGITLTVTVNLANARSERGVLEEAAETFRYLLEDVPASDPPPSWRTRALIGLGFVRLEQGRPAEAEPLLRQALSELRANPASVGRRRVEAEAYLGGTLNALERYDEAETVLLNARSTYQTGLQVPYHIRARVLEELIESYEARALTDEAARVAAELELLER